MSSKKGAVRIGALARERTAFIDPGSLHEEAASVMRKLLRLEDRAFDEEWNAVARWIIASCASKGPYAIQAFQGGDEQHGKFVVRMLASIVGEMRCYDQDFFLSYTPAKMKHVMQKAMNDPYIPIVSTMPDTASALLATARKSRVLAIAGIRFIPAEFSQVLSAISDGVEMSNGKTTEMLCRPILLQGGEGFIQRRTA